jgi:hypothetical protein
VVRGHHIRRMLGCAALPGQSHQAPQLLAALPSVFVPFQDRSVENLAANGLAGILNALQMTLARWSALSPKLTAEQKAYVHRCLSRGSGPIVSIVRNVSAISLQMALRCYFSRKCMRHLRQMQRMRVGADRSEDMPEVAAPPAQDLDYVSFDEFRSSVAARHILRAEAVHPGLLVRQSGTSPARGTPADVYRPDRRYTQDDAEGAMLLTADQRLSASVATFVRQMSHMLQQRERESPLHHRKSLVSLLHSVQGPLAKNLQHLSAMSLQAVVRGHQVRRRVHSFVRAVGEISKLEIVSKLSLAQAIGAGRQLFAFQGRHLGGTNTFFSAVCSGNGFVSDVLRHACSVAIQCAFRARRSRHAWAREAMDALLKQAAGTCPSWHPWLKYTKARLEGEPVEDGRNPGVPAGGLKKAISRECKTAAAKPPEPKLEIKYNWMSTPSAQAPPAPSELHSSHTETVQNRAQKQGTLEAQESRAAHETRAAQDVTGAASSQQERIAQREAHELDRASSSTEYETSESLQGSVSADSYQSESQDEEWDLQVAEDEYQIFQQARNSCASPRPVALSHQEAAARAEADVVTRSSMMTPDQVDAQEQSKDLSAQYVLPSQIPLAAHEAEQRKKDQQEDKPSTYSFAALPESSQPFAEAETANEEEPPRPTHAAPDGARASLSVVPGTGAASPDGPVGRDAAPSHIESGQIESGTDTDVPTSKSSKWLGSAPASSARTVHTKAGPGKLHKLSLLSTAAHEWMEAIPVREGGLESVKVSWLLSAAQPRMACANCFTTGPSKEQTPLSRSMRPLWVPVLIACMRGEAGWRRHMMGLAPKLSRVLRHDSALYQVLYDGYDFLEMDARAEAAQSLAHLCSVSLSCRLFVIDQGTVGDVCAMLKRRNGPRVALASLLERLAYDSPRSVVSWVQVHSFARIELFLLHLLDIIHEARMETTSGAVAHDGAASLIACQQAPDVHRLTNHILRVVLNLAESLKGYGWQQLRARGGIERIVSLLSGPPLPAGAHDLISLALSSLLMDANGRGRFKACNGLGLLVAQMRDSEDKPAAAAAHVVRVYLVATQELAIDAASLIALGCDHALISLIARIRRTHPTRAENGGGGMPTLAGLVPVVTLLLQAESTKEELLRRNPDLLALTLDMLKDCSQSPSQSRQKWALNLACVRLFSGVMSSTNALHALRAAGAVEVFERCFVTAATHQHRSLAASILARLEPRSVLVSSHAEQMLSLEESLRSLFGGLMTQEPPDQLECLRGLVGMASSLDGRRLMLNLKLQAGTRMSTCARVPVEVIVAALASACPSTREPRNGSPEPQVAAQIRTECAKLVYLLADPEEEAVAIGGVVAEMLHSGILHVLFAAIQEERGGKSIKLGTEARGPALVLSLAALFRLLTHATVREAMQDSASALTHLFDLMTLMGSHNTSVSLYAIFIIGKLFSDGISRHSCRRLVADSRLLSSLILMLQDSYGSSGASQTAAGVEGWQEGRVRRSAVLHTLAALSHLKLARQAFAGQECLPLIFRAMAEATVVACRLTLDKRDADMLLPTSDFPVAPSRKSSI